MTELVWSSAFFVFEKDAVARCRTFFFVRCPSFFVDNGCPKVVVEIDFRYDEVNFSETVDFSNDFRKSRSGDSDGDVLVCEKTTLVADASGNFVLVVIWCGDKKQIESHDVLTSSVECCLTA